MIRQRRRALRPTLDRLDDRCLLSGLTPSQVTRAYGLDAITFGANGQTIAGDGSGQTIAIVDAYHNPYLSAGLHAFDQMYQLPDPSLIQVNLAGATTNDGWAQEEALDVEWAHAIAPGARIVVVEARSESVKDLLAAVDVARNVAGVSVVSMSWGGGETSGELRNDSHFTTPAGHTGITFVTASGDEGARGGAEWPSASSRVVSVGGTTLQISSAGAYLGESAWSGSSGGYSKYVTEPGYQRTVQASGRRSTPDVAFDADPATGVSVFTIAPSSGIGNWRQIGGTSLGAPAWAAIIAIADQGRATAGASTLDGASQTLPLLYNLPTIDFHQSGSLTSTGLGSPNGASLVNGLAFGLVPSSNGAIRSARTRIRKNARRATVAIPAIVHHDAALHELASKLVRHS
jgi:subtilase family serine protease